MKEDSSGSGAVGGGLGLSGVLGVVFIVLKLTGNITWSWFWVLSPFWIPWAIVIAVLVVALLFVGLAKLYGNGGRDDYLRPKRRRW